MTDHKPSAFLLSLADAHSNACVRAAGRLRLRTAIVMHPWAPGMAGSMLNNASKDLLCATIWFRGARSELKRAGHGGGGYASAAVVRLQRACESIACSQRAIAKQLARLEGRSGGKDLRAALADLEGRLEACRASIAGFQGLMVNLCD